MALRPRLSTGLLLSVLMLVMFYGRNVITMVAPVVKNFRLTIIMDFPCQISFVIPDLGAKGVLILMENKSQ